MRSSSLSGSLLEFNYTRQQPDIVTGRPRHDPCLPRGSLAGGKVTKLQLSTGSNAWERETRERLQERLATRECRICSCRAAGPSQAGKARKGPEKERCKHLLET